MATSTQTGLFEKKLVLQAVKQSFIKLNPAVMIKNPVMFTVEIGTLVMFLVTLYILLSGDSSQGSFAYNLTVFLILFLTLLFANFAEAIAEARGKAQAESLRKTREETPARIVSESGTIQTISSSRLKKGNVSLAEVEVNHFQNQLDITWKPLQREGQVKIWVTTTNAFKQGGKDTYQLMAQVPLNKGQTAIDVSKIPSEYYKIVVEGPANSVSKWYMPVEKQK